MKKGFDIKGFVVTDVGLRRDNNEDNYLLQHDWNKSSVDRIQQEYKDIDSDKWKCFAVFDGMGGGENGEWASLVATEAVYQAFVECNRNKASDRELDERMQRAFKEANNKIVEDGKRRGVFGTTGTVLVSNRFSFRIYHVGDSRAYLYRNGMLRQLTTDHTLAELKIKLGYYEKGAPQMERDKHQLMNFIGSDTTMDNLDVSMSEWIDWQENDQILLCSDGLYDMCSDETIEFILSQRWGLGKKENQLLTYALRNGGRDNVTCILLQANNQDAELNVTKRQMNRFNRSLTNSFYLVSDEEDEEMDEKVSVEHDITQMKVDYWNKKDVKGWNEL